MTRRSLRAPASYLARLERDVTLDWHRWLMIRKGVENPEHALPYVTHAHAVPALLLETQPPAACADAGVLGGGTDTAWGVAAHTRGR